MDRVKIFQIILITIVVAIVVRLAYWQFISDAASESGGISREITLPATRGEILASDNFPLATNQEAYILYAKPKEIKEDPANIAKKIAPYFISEKFATLEGQISEEDEKLKKIEIENEEKKISEQLRNVKLSWVQIAR